jgi:hypothetical protein
MSFSHFKMILRIMFQNWRSTLINYLGLLLGLTSFVIIFSWIRSEYSVDKYHTNKDRLYQLVIQFPEGFLDANTPYALAPAMKEVFPEVENYSRLVKLESQVSSSFDFFPENPDNDPVYEANVARVDTGFFGMFTVSSLNGNVERGIERPDGVLLSKELAEKYFGDTNPVGRQILMNGDQLLEVTGVVDVPDNSQFDFDLFLPTGRELLNSWNWRDPSFIMLKKGTDRVSFEEKIGGFLNQTIPNPLPEEFPLKIVPIGKSNLVFGKRKEFLLFSGIAILILIIVAINYMNLSTANYTRRIREMGVRKIHGATPEMLRNQLIAETLIQTFVAMFFALFLAELLLPRLNMLFNDTVSIGYRTHPAIIPGFILLAILLSMLSVAYPVIVFTRGNPTSILRDSFVKGRGRSNMLLITTVFQFTISVTLLISTLVVIRQVRFARKTPPGVNIEQVIKIQTNPQIAQKLFAFFDELETYPGILETTAGQSNPVNENYKTNIDWPLRKPETNPLVRYSLCLPDYPAFFGYEITLGRLFRDHNLSDGENYLVNEAACQMLGKENPVGDKITMWGNEGKIVGVFRNYQHTSIHTEIMPQIVSINPSFYPHLRYMFIRLSPDKQKESIKFISHTFKEFAGDFPFSYEFLSDETDQMYAKDIRLAKILGSFALMAMLISCLGIYGLARFSAERKIRDLTIRRVFGASFIKIIQLAHVDMLRRIGLSVVIAIPASYFLLERWLRSFAYRTDLSWWLFFLGGLIGISITIAATMIGIWRSLKQKPIEVLKQV